MTAATTATMSACVMGHEPVRAKKTGPRVAMKSIQIIGDQAIPRIMGRPVFINRFLVSMSGNSFMIF